MGPLRARPESGALARGAPSQVGAFGDPGRDPRGWTVTVAYAALVPRSARERVAAAVSRASLFFPAAGRPKGAARAPTPQLPACAVCQPAQRARARARAASALPADLLRLAASQPAPAKQTQTLKG